MLLKLIFIAYLLIISFLAFSPNNAGINVGGDKTNHILAFTVFTILNFFAFRKRFFHIFIYGLSFGIFIEFVQYFLPYRDADIMDILADSIGLVAGVLLLYMIKDTNEEIKL